MLGGIKKAPPKKLELNGNDGEEDEAKEAEKNFHDKDGKEADLEAGDKDDGKEDAAVKAPPEESKMNNKRAGQGTLSCLRCNATCAAQAHRRNCARNAENQRCEANRRVLVKCWRCAPRTNI